MTQPDNDLLALYARHTRLAQELETLLEPPPDDAGYGMFEKLEADLIERLTEIEDRMATITATTPAGIAAQVAIDASSSGRRGKLHDTIMRGLKQLAA